MPALTIAAQRRQLMPDYSRIYGEFIADRRSRPAMRGALEAHHIQPRSKGGSDEPTNLIDLTPEDHFFAHLLLAKIYGGRLWVPVVMWLGGKRRNWKGRRSRLAYGWAARAAVAANKGKAAHQYDHTIHRLVHPDGRTWQGTQADARDALGLDRSGLNMLVKAKLKSFHGWYVEGRLPPERGGMSHPMATPDVHHLVHVDGREFVGTQHEFRVAHGVNRASVSRLLRHQQRIAAGWMIKGVTPHRVGRGAAFLKAAA